MGTPCCCTTVTFPGASKTAAALHPPAAASRPASPKRPLCQSFPGTFSCHIPPPAETKAPQGRTLSPVTSRQSVGKIGGQTSAGPAARHLPLLGSPPVVTSSRYTPSDAVTNSNFITSRPSFTQRSPMEIILIPENASHKPLLAPVLRATMEFMGISSCRGIPKVCAV